MACLAFCVHYVVEMINWFAKYYRYVFYLMYALIACDVWYLGQESDRSVFYMIVFAISFVLGYFLHKKKIDPVPMIFVWMLGPHFWPTAYRLLQLYVL
jgi:TctA family transporter